MSFCNYKALRAPCMVDSLLVIIKHATEEGSYEFSLLFCLDSSDLGKLCWSLKAICDFECHMYIHMYIHTYVHTTLHEINES